MDRRKFFGLCIGGIGTLILPKVLQKDSIPTENIDLSKLTDQELSTLQNFHGILIVDDPLSQQDKNIIDDLYEQIFTNHNS